MCGAVQGKKNKNSSWRGKKGTNLWKGSDFQMVNCNSAVVWWVFFPPPVCLSVCLSVCSLFLSGKYLLGGPGIQLAKYHAESFADWNCPGLVGVYLIFIFSWGDFTRKVTFLSNISSLLFRGAIRCDGSSSCCFLLNFKSPSKIWRLKDDGIESFVVIVPSPPTLCSLLFSKSCSN